MAARTRGRWRAAEAPTWNHESRLPGRLSRAFHCVVVRAISVTGSDVVKTIRLSGRIRHATRIAR